MRLLSKFALLGGAALATAAIAGELPVHVLDVALPDGTVQQVRYTGDIAPQLVLVPVAAADPFAEMDRMVAAMDAQMNAMLRQASTLAAAPVGPDGAVNLAAAKSMPADAVSYSFFASSNGKATCSQSVQMTSAGAGQQPKVVSQQSGDCSAFGKPALQASAPVAAAPKTQAEIIKAKIDAAPVKPPVTNS